MKATAGRARCRHGSTPVQAGGPLMLSTPVQASAPDPAAQASPELPVLMFLTFQPVVSLSAKSSLTK